MGFFDMELTRNSPEILRRTRSYQYAEAVLERAIQSGNQHLAKRAADLATALHARMDAIMFETVSIYKDN